MSLDCNLYYQLNDVEVVNAYKCHYKMIIHAIQIFSPLILWRSDKSHSSPSSYEFLSDQGLVVAIQVFLNNAFIGIWYSHQDLS